MLKEIGIIDINQYFIRVVVITFNSISDNFVIQKVAIERAPENSVKNSVIVDSLAVKNSILKLIRQNRIKTRTFYLTVSGRYTYTKPLDIPQLEDSDIYKALDLQIRNLIPIQKNVVYDFLTLSNLSSKNQRILLVALEEETIISRLNLLNTIKLSIKGVNVSSISSAHLFQNKLYENKTIAIIFVSDISTDVVVIKKGKISFIRTIQIGLNDFINSISQKRKITEGESFNLWLNSYANFGVTDSDGFKEEVLPVIESISSEIEESILFYENLPEGEVIELVILCGEISRFINLDYYLQSKLSKKIVYYKLSDYISLNKDEIAESIFAPVSMEFSHLIGQAVSCLSDGKVGSINLLPREFVKKEKESKFALINIFLFVLFLSCLVAHFFYTYNKLKISEKKLKNLELKIKGMDMSYIEKLEEDNKNLTHKVKALRILYLDEIPIKHIVKEVAILIPQNVFLKRMEMEKDGSLLIDGRAETQEEVGFVLESLKSSKFFKNVSLISTHKFQDENGKEYTNFKMVITCKIRAELSKNNETKN